MPCAQCTHFLVGAAASAREFPTKVHDRPSPDGEGVCRRYPPRFVSDVEHGDTMSLFPYVHRDHHCGEYAADDRWIV